MMTSSAQTALINGAEPAQAPPRPALHVIKPSSGVDLGAAEHAAAAFLVALGVDLDTESMAATPARMARAYAEMFSPRPFDLTTFPNDAGYDELIIARSIPVQSVCEHHLLPFVGVAHVGYLPRERILGLSKLARVVELFARRPQVQERLTQQVADWLQDQLAPRGVGVVVAAEHLCMTVRGVRASGANTVTSALHGQLRSDAASRAEFFTLIAAHEEAYPGLCPSTSSGHNSTSSGHNSTSSGHNSTGSGHNSTGSGHNSTSSGHNSTGSGDNS